MFCPLSKTPCEGSKCAWYMAIKEQCAMHQLSEDLMRIRINLELQKSKKGK
jgi:hypothetical protein